MTEEQLQQYLQQTNDQLKALSDAGRPLTKEEQKERGKLQVRQGILNSIKASKTAQNRSAELYNVTLWEMLLSWGERRPVLMFFAANILKTRFGIGGFRV